MTTHAETAARFWALVQKGEPDECWLWLGANRGLRGYGQFRAFGRNRPAHRFSWEFHNGQTIPKGMDACHRCDNPPCVNPAHIFPGTRSDNMLDASRKGRHRGLPTLTHCKRGHEFTPENTYIQPANGGRACLTCRHLRAVERWARDLKAPGGMVGRRYLERGKPVVVIVRWGTGGGPRNVLIERADGERVVRPFRGLRRIQVAA